MMRITLSFKQTTRDTKIYKLINSQEEKSEYVKNAVEYYFKYLNEKK